MNEAAQSNKRRCSLRAAFWRSIRLRSISSIRQGITWVLSVCMNRTPKTVRNAQSAKTAEPQATPETSRSRRLRKGELKAYSPQLSADGMLLLVPGKTLEAVVQFLDIVELAQIVPHLVRCGRSSWQRIARAYRRVSPCARMRSHGLTVGFWRHAARVRRALGLRYM